MKYVKKIGFTISVIIICVGFDVRFVHAQTLKDELTERTVETEELTPAEMAEQQRALKARWTSNLMLAYGYDTNPLLTPLRKGDHYQKARYTLNFRKTYWKRNQFNFLFDINQDNYSEKTDINNTLGHILLDHKIALSKKYLFGLGYDYSFSYFARSEDSTFYFHKAFVSFEQRLTKNFFHNIKVEKGWKVYDSALALFRGPASFKDNKREDVREKIAYSMGYTFTDRVSGRIIFSSAFNDSNALYQNFHDYHIREVAPRLSFKVNDKLSTNMSYSYKYKDFKSRRTTDKSAVQIDKTHSMSAGLRYRPNNKHSVMLDYTYRENNSNDELSHYTGSQIEGGWQYIF